uniref:Uncharacterized protein n=1 Tax=Dunaliella tertiolecta TaxID=3047 RepID=A0A7S3QLF1_DUNTE
MPTDLPPQSETEEACNLLGIHMYDPPKPLPRVPARIDGKQCLCNLLHTSHGQVQRSPCAEVAGLQQKCDRGNEGWTRNDRSVVYMTRILQVTLEWVLEKLASFLHMLMYKMQGVTMLLRSVSKNLWRHARPMRQPLAGPMQTHSVKSPCPWHGANEPRSSWDSAQNRNTHMSSKL